MACILSIERLHGWGEIQLTACRFDEAARPETVHETAQKGKIGCVMRKLTKSRPAGFTIIELMIVTMIIAILVALAYPSYIDYVRKAKRGEAQQLLLNWAINQEIYRSNNPTYDDGTDIDPPEHDDYTLTVTGATATAYTLTADADGDQAGDKAKDGSSCEILTLNENGAKEPAGCWN